MATFLMIPALDSDDSTAHMGTNEDKMNTYTITGNTLTIPDPDAFGFEGADLDAGSGFKVVSDEFERERRSYNINTLVIKHEESGRFFATEYSTHEDEGFEWEPGCGRGGPVIFSEVFPHVVSVTVYKDTPAT